MQCNKQDPFRGLGPLLSDYLRLVWFVMSHTTWVWRWDKSSTQCFAQARVDCSCWAVSCLWVFDKWKLNGHFFKVHLNSLDCIYSSHFTSDALSRLKLSVQERWYEEAVLMGLRVETTCCYSCDGREREGRADSCQIKTRFWPSEHIKALNASQLHRFNVLFGQQRLVKGVNRFIDSF